MWNSNTLNFVVIEVSPWINFLMGTFTIVVLPTTLP
jgi:hypothetical protein